jgi:hypothetical protein
VTCAAPKIYLRVFYRSSTLIEAFHCQSFNSGFLYFDDVRATMVTMVILAQKTVRSKSI